jgi:hypothetical protein
MMAAICDPAVCGGHDHHRYPLILAFTQMRTERARDSCRSVPSGTTQDGVLFRCAVFSQHCPSPKTLSTRAHRKKQVGNYEGEAQSVTGSSSPAATALSGVLPYLLPSKKVFCIALQFSLLNTSRRQIHCANPTSLITGGLVWRVYDLALSDEPPNNKDDLPCTAIIAASFLRRVVSLRWPLNAIADSGCRFASTHGSDISPRPHRLTDDLGAVMRVLTEPTQGLLTTYIHLTTLDISLSMCRHACRDPCQSRQGCPQCMSGSRT